MFPVKQDNSLSYEFVYDSLKEAIDNVLYLINEIEEKDPDLMQISQIEIEALKLKNRINQERSYE